MLYDPGRNLTEDDPEIIVFSIYFHRNKLFYVYLFIYPFTDIYLSF